ncbi:MAG: hypothetical protein KTR14_06495 [Vampirovibrio sp.]|nr:hypothetical protein [Vampirovibrio sp.]
MSADQKIGSQKIATLNRLHAQMRQADRSWDQKLSDAFLWGWTFLSWGYSLAVRRWGAEPVAATGFILLAVALGVIWQSGADGRSVKHIIVEHRMDGDTLISQVPIKKQMSLTNAKQLDEADLAYVESLNYGNATQLDEGSPMAMQAIAEKMTQNNNSTTFKTSYAAGRPDPFQPLVRIDDGTGQITFGPEMMEPEVNLVGIVQDQHNKAKAVAMIWAHDPRSGTKRTHVKRVGESFTLDGQKITLKSIGTNQIRFTRGRKTETRKLIDFMDNNMDASSAPALGVGPAPQSASATTAGSGLDGLEEI